MFFYSKTNSATLDSYSTGASQPPVKHRWLSFVLLVSFIFVGGIFTGMNLLNIRLFQAKAPTQLTRASYTQDSNFSGKSTFFGEGVIATYDALGFTGQEITGFCQLYYDLPQGIYVTSVASAGACANLLLPGDIVVTCHGRPVPSHTALQQQLSSLPENTAFYLGVYRQNELIYLRLTPESRL